MLIFAFCVKLPPLKQRWNPNCTKLKETRQNTSVHYHPIWIKHKLEIHAHYSIKIFIFRNAILFYCKTQFSLYFAIKPFNCLRVSWWKNSSEDYWLGRKATFHMTGCDFKVKTKSAVSQISNIHLLVCYNLSKGSQAL